MRKIFLFLFAAVLSIGTAMAGTVTLVDVGEIGATFTGDGEYAESTTVTVTASHEDVDWVFAYWKHQDGEIASYDAEYTFTMGTEDVVLEAYFAMGGTVSDMTNLVIDTETYADSYMAVLTGSDMMNGLEVMLAVSENIEGDLYKLGAAEVYFGGSPLDFVSGTVTIDMDAYTAVANVIVSLGGELMAITCNMSATAAAPVDVMVGGATVTFDNDGGALKFNGTDVYGGDDVYVELSGFEYNGAETYTLSVAQISMFENSTAFAFADEVEVTVEADGTVSVEGTYTSYADGSIYNVFIWGALPKYTLTLTSDVSDAVLTGAGTYYAAQEVTVTATPEPTGWVFNHWDDGEENVSTNATYTFRLGKNLELTANYAEVYTRTVTKGNYGTICLPYTAARFSGATFYELVQAKKDNAGNVTEVLLGSVDKLDAGVPYIFQATATELVVYSDGNTANSAGNHNGLYGTFTDNTSVAAGNYILLNNEFRPSDGNAKVNANRAWVVMSEVPTATVQQMPGRRYISMGVQGENEATGLDNIITNTNAVKVIENGQLIIIRNGEKFNVQGIKL